MRGIYGMIIGAVALATTTITACGDSTAPGQTSGREIGVLQLETAGGTLTAALGETGGRDTTSTSGPIKWDHAPVPGAITPPLVIELPDTVQVGQQVNVIVRTVLMDGCWRTDGQDVVQTGLTVEVTPHDAHSGAQICTLIYGLGEHRFTTTFSTRGLATVRLHGRLLRQANNSVTTEAVTAERTTVVR